MHEILPLLQGGKTVLVAAHGNSLRAIVMAIEGLTPERSSKRELGTGEPMVYQIGAGWEAGGEGGDLNASGLGCSILPLKGRTVPLGMVSPSDRAIHPPMGEVRRIAWNAASVALMRRRNHPGFPAQNRPLARHAPVIAGQRAADVPTTRWQGTTKLIGFLPTAAPTARDAVGRPIWLATLDRSSPCRRDPEQRLPDLHLEIGADQHHPHRPLRITSAPGRTPARPSGATRASSRVKRALGQRLARSSKASSMTWSSSAKPMPDMPYSVPSPPRCRRARAPRPRPCRGPRPPARKTPGRHGLVGDEQVVQPRGRARGRPHRWCRARSAGRAAASWHGRAPPPGRSSWAEPHQRRNRSVSCRSVSPSARAKRAGRSVGPCLAEVADGGANGLVVRGIGDDLVHGACLMVGASGRRRRVGRPGFDAQADQTRACAQRRAEGLGEARLCRPG